MGRQPRGIAHTKGERTEIPAASYTRYKLNRLAQIFTDFGGNANHRRPINRERPDAGKQKADAQEGAVGLVSRGITEGLSLSRE